MGDLLAIGSCAGKFYVFDRQTGGLRWSYDIRQDGRQASFHGKPLVVGHTVIVGTDDGCDPDAIGHVYAFDLNNNAVQWKQRFKGVFTSVVLSGDAIFFGTVMDDWYKAELASGAPLWKYQVKADNPTCGFPRAPINLGGKVCFVGHDSAIYILDSASGNLLSRVQPPSPPSTALATYHEQFLFGAEDNRLYSLDPSTAKVHPILQFHGRPSGTLQVDADTLYLFLNGPEQKGQLASVDLTSNRVRWTQTADRAWASVEPRVSHDLVLAGNCRGQVSAFSVVDGRQLWSEQFPGCIRSIGASGDLLYIGSQEGMLYAYAPAW